MTLCVTHKSIRNLAAALVAAVAVAGCTQSVPHQQELSNQEGAQDAVFTVNTLVVSQEIKKVDILWVIDNSDSMKSSQDRLRAGLENFAKTYLLRDNTDIQMGVIATDAYAANEAWAKWRATLPKTLTQGKGKNKKTYPITIGPDSATLKHVMSTKNGKSLIGTFQKEVAQGTAGVYEEHGFESVLEMLQDNEKDSSKTKLFRPGSQRIIVFLSDEDDQSLRSPGPEPRKLLYTGSYYTGRDAAKAAQINPPHFTQSCPTTVVEGVTLEPLTICIDPNAVMPVADFKSDLDGFFRKLDGGADNPNYMVVAIVAKDLATIQDLRSSSDELTPEGAKVITHEQGRRYLDLVSEVPGSLAMDIGAKDYSPILKQIGLQIEHRSVVAQNTANVTFKLPYPIDQTKEVTVAVENGSASTRLSKGQYSIQANVVQIVDPKLVSTLKPGDRIRVHYRPASQLPVLN